MRIAVDAVGIRGHGGAAVLCELLHWLPIARPDWRWHVFLFERDLREFDDPVVSGNVTLEHVRHGDRGWERLTWVNRYLPTRCKTIGVDVLFSFADVAPANPTIPQVVFCHQRKAFSSEGLSDSAILARVRLWIIRRHILRGALASQAMIVQTEAMRERITQVEPRLQGRIHVIPSGYRTPSGNPTIRPETKSLVDNASRPRLIYVSHPSEHKNHLSLVRAVPGILQVFPSASLLLTLDPERPGDRGYTGFVRAIRREAELLGVSDRLVWLGLINPDEVDSALRSSDLLVFPSFAESFGLGLVESMAAGCPIAAADLPYAHDVCGDAAVYFAPERPESIAETVAKVCSDGTALHRLRVSGAERKARFAYGEIAAESACILETATQGAKQG